MPKHPNLRPRKSLRNRQLGLSDPVVIRLRPRWPPRACPRIRQGCPRELAMLALCIPLRLSACAFQRGSGADTAAAPLRPRRLNRIPRPATNPGGITQRSPRFLGREATEMRPFVGPFETALAPLGRHSGLSRGLDRGRNLTRTRRVPATRESR